MSASNVNDLIRTERELRSRRDAQAQRVTLERNKLTKVDAKHRDELDKIKRQSEKLTADYRAAQIKVNKKYEKERKAQERAHKAAVMNINRLESVLERIDREITLNGDRIRQAQKSPANTNSASSSHSSRNMKLAA